MRIRSWIAWSSVRPSGGPSSSPPSGTVRAPKTGRLGSGSCGTRPTPPPPRFWNWSPPGFERLGGTRDEVAGAAADDRPVRVRGVAGEVAAGARDLAEARLRRRRVAGPAAAAELPGRGRLAGRRPRDGQGRRDRRQEAGRQGSIVHAPLRRPAAADDRPGTGPAGRQWSLSAGPTVAVEPTLPAVRIARAAGPAGQGRSPWRTSLACPSPVARWRPTAASLRGRTDAEATMSTQTPPLVPLRFEPILKRLIWGGRRLGTVLRQADRPRGRLRRVLGALRPPARPERRRRRAARRPDPARAGRRAAAPSCSGRWSAPATSSRCSSSSSTPATCSRSRSTRTTRAAVGLRRQRQERGLGRRRRRARQPDLRRPEGRRHEARVRRGAGGGPGRSTCCTPSSRGRATASTSRPGPSTRSAPG